MRRFDTTQVLVQPQASAAPRRPPVDMRAHGRRCRAFGTCRQPPRPLLLDSAAAPFGVRCVLVQSDSTTVVATRHACPKASIVTEDRPFTKTDFGFIMQERAVATRERKAPPS